MNAAERYRFDLNGYLVVEDALDPETLARLNQRADAWESRSLEALAHPDDHRTKPWEYEAGEVFFELGPRKALVRDIVNLEPEFLDVADAPALLPYVTELVPQPRLKSSWLTFKWQGGGTGGHGSHVPYSACNHYAFVEKIRCNLLIALVALKDIPAGGGALRVIPGSHKANLPLPAPDDRRDLIVEVPLKAGSALVFSHDLYHESHNSREDVRRTVIVTYAPGVIANSYGGDRLYDGLFARQPEGSWRKYLLRRPNGFAETYEAPKTRELSAVV